MIMDKTALRLEMSKIATDIINGSTNPVYGIRKIRYLSFETGDSELDFIRDLRGIETELDFYPAEESRINFASHLLDKYDIEAKSYLESVGEILKGACRKVISEFDPQRLRTK